jgi:KUP system potassium uptake protein
MQNPHSHHAQKITLAGLLVTLGIIYGDIGTSPLYVMKSIVGENLISPQLIEGGLSCVFWTLTIQTTFKYVLLTLNVDNNGEGGVFSLYALVRKKGKWLTIPAIIGGSALLADGVITPPISVSSAIEGLRILNPEIPTIPIVIAIISVLFMFQTLGTSLVGKIFGPVMFVWFSMLGILGTIAMFDNLDVLKCLNPYYAYDLLVNYPQGFWLLGAVFLCTTGAEALYSDLGHCGKGNIRITWIFVKTCLLLNYFGQGAWLLNHESQKLNGLNPFFEIMPDWFLLIGIGIATMAAIIASQALISGSFTLVSEAMRLTFWPKVQIIYPTNLKGQIYVPSINKLLWLGCIFVVLYFQESAHMEAAYGLAITLTMLMTTILLAFYLRMRGISMGLLVFLLFIFLSIELSFLVSNLLKFTHGGWVSLLLGSLIAFVMFVWLKATQIKKQLTEYTKLQSYVPHIKELSNDTDVPKYATHLVYLTASAHSDEIEVKIIESIFDSQPKRADIYWFVHVETVDDPFTMEYKIDNILRNDLVRVTFRLGFRIDMRINLFFKKVLAQMIKDKQVDVMTNRYETLANKHAVGDIEFIVMRKFLSFENELNTFEEFIMEAYFFIKSYTISEEDWFGLDKNNVKIETMPLIIDPVQNLQLKKIDK